MRYNGVTRFAGDLDGRLRKVQTRRAVLQDFHSLGFEMTLEECMRFRPCCEVPAVGSVKIVQKDDCECGESPAIGSL